MISINSQFSGWEDAPRAGEPTQVQPPLRVGNWKWVTIRLWGSIQPQSHMLRQLRTMLEEVNFPPLRAENVK